MVPAMPFDLSSLMNRASAVIGVNPGYEGDAMTIKDPLDAAIMVQREIRRLNLQAEIFPGLVVYPVKFGCPVGGEPVGVVTWSPRMTSVEHRIPQLRDDFGQTTVAIAKPLKEKLPIGFIATRGFAANLGRAKLSKIALEWQDAARPEFERTGISVSGVAYKAGGDIFVQADANPTKIQDLKEWEAIAKRVMAKVAPRSNLFFRDRAFQYLAPAN